MFKWLFWLGLIGGSVLVAGQVIPVYYNNLKIENIFEGVSQKLVNSDTTKIEQRIDQLISIQNVNEEILPDEFFNNLNITKEDGKIQIGSEYHVTLWLLGEPTSVSPNEEYAEKDVKPMDKLRIRARLDFDFSPYAETP